MRVQSFIFLLLIAPALYGQWFKREAKKDSITTIIHTPSIDTSIYEKYTFFSDKYEDFIINQRFYKSGQLCWEFFEVNGERDGPHRSWYENGQLRVLMYYHFGLPTGFYTSWYKNGNIESYGQFEKFNLRDTIYKIDSIKQKIYDCDTFHIERNYPPYDSYDSVTCSNNVLYTGRWVEYYINGKLKSEKFFSYGNKVKTWKYYTDDGELTKEEIYENNKLIRTINK